MHELGIVFYIIRDVKQVAQENGVKHVSAVVMDIGEVSCRTAGAGRQTRKTSSKAANSALTPYPQSPGAMHAKANTAPWNTDAPVRAAAAGRRGYFEEAK